MGNKQDEARSLEQRLVNYKKTQAKTAKSKGDEVYRDLMSAPNLTQARIAVYGKKEKNYSGFRGSKDSSNKYTDFDKKSKKY